MKTNIIAALVMGFILIATSGIAQNRVDKRQKAQRARIVDGRQDGEVTQGETALLRREQRSIRRTEQSEGRWYLNSQRKNSPGT